MSGSTNIKLEKTETELYKAKLQYARLLEYSWQPGREFALNEYVRPSGANGFAFKATTAGQSASTEPRWPTTLAATVTDGSITWTAVAIDSNSRDSISSINAVVPSGITVSTPTNSGSRVLFDISGGTKGSTYIISIEVTTSTSEVFEDKVEVFIKSE